MTKQRQEAGIDMEYKYLERQEHISIDDSISKVTQEVCELIEAIASQDSKNIYAEAGDVLTNIISVASEMGCDIDELDTQSLDSEQGVPDLIRILGKWNEQVQTLRGRYSRKIGNISELETLTKTFISSVLNYTHPSSSLGEILETNVYKLMSRKDMYKPNINPRDYITEYPNFPKEGINFKDISPLLVSPDALKYVCHEMAEKCRGADKIVALDARGFIFAPMIGQILSIPWVMARKPGKLPGETVSINYELEYGSNTIELQKGAIMPGEKIAIVDDLLATGGTVMATIKLVEELGGEVYHCAFVIALDEDFLLGQPTRYELQKYPHSSIVSYID